MAFSINVKEINPLELRQAAEDCYRQGGYNCTETILKTFIEGLKLDIPIEALAIASGFGSGMGGAGCACGAVTGGVMVLSLVFGTHERNDVKRPIAMHYVKQLHDSFKDNHHSICCRILTKNIQDNSEKKENCIKLIGDITEKVAQIINEAILEKETGFET